MAKQARIDQQFFLSVFKKLYAEKWERQGKTEQQLADAINEYTKNNPGEKTGGTSYKKGRISDWKNGRGLPSADALKAISATFGVDESVFKYDSMPFVDRYEKDAQFTQEIEDDLLKTAKNNFGIDPLFFQGLKSIIPDFDKKFPIFTPLHFYEDDAQKKPYERRLSAGAAAPAGRGGLFRIKKGNGFIFLTINDMKTIKALQDYLKECAYQFFETKAAEFKVAEEAVNLEYKKRNPSGSFIAYDLSEEELQQMDPMGIYSEEEKEKYHLEDIEKVAMTQEEFFGRKNR